MIEFLPLKSSQLRALVLPSHMITQSLNSVGGVDHEIRGWDSQVMHELIATFDWNYKRKKNEWKEFKKDQIMAILEIVNFV